MTYRGHLTREQIGLRAPRSRSTNIDASQGGVTAHYAGGAQGVSLALSGHSRCLALWRGYQNYHMDKHGWADIAYSLGVCQHGYILAGRGANVRTGANGTNAGNSYWYAICFILGGNEEPSQDAIDAFWVAVFMLRSKGGAANRVNDHSKHKSTACAGDPVRAVIAAGEPTMSSGHNPIDNKAHSLASVPSWAPWKEYVADGGSTLPESGVWPTSRSDLAWFNYNSPLAKKVEFLEGKVARLEKALDAHTSNHPSASGGISESTARSIAKSEIKAASLVPRS